MKKYMLALLLSTIILVPIHMPVKAVNTSLSDGSIYYVLIDRFTNGESENDKEINIDDPQAFHGGDLQGVINKLDYIKQLGFTTINLSPVMQSDVYHGFAPSDYQKVNEQFGKMDILKQLVDAAHEQNIKVILDMPVSQISSKHPWVLERPEWLGEPVSNTWGENLPSPDLTNPKVSNYFLETANMWLDETGIDGFRLYTNQYTPIEFIELFAEHIKTVKSDAITVLDSGGEIEKPNLLLVNNTLKETISSILSEPGNSLEPLFEDNLLTELNDINFVDSVETVRFTRESVKQGQNPTTRWKLALTYLYTIPGTPTIYQGSEVPMDNGMDIPGHQMAELNTGEDELRNYMEQLMAIRSEFPAITKGDIQFVDSSGAMVLFKREYDDKSVYIAMNNDKKSQVISLADVPDGMQLTGLLQDNIVREHEDGLYRIGLERETADIFIIEEDKGLNWLFVGFIVLVLGTFVFSVIYLSRKNKKEARS
ncbi:alpha-amylase family glycosyl hydrolase [Aquibacillus kalidii]|uniref:alpha-amylase family glycosyl hydrolase n=1 Tax=Aquibacillus kalidii TaxID=2762597 RepID=UPI0016475FBD|nr:alpha-amylase family glycosyl hydrolase [Aquibacillus kalidii]